MNVYRIHIMQQGDQKPFETHKFIAPDIESCRVKVHEHLDGWVEESDVVAHSLADYIQGEPMYQALIVPPEGGDASDIYAVYARVATIGAGGEVNWLIKKGAAA